MKSGRRERGQAIAEVPIAVATLTFVALCMFQVVAHLHCRIAVGHAAVAVARVASTSSPVSRSISALQAYAESLLSDLPAGSAFYRRGSLRVSVEGSPRSAQVVATVSVLQVPLPIVGLPLAGSDGAIEVAATASAQGAERWAAGDDLDGELVVGQGWNDD